MIEKQRGSCKELLQDLDEARDELFASLKKSLRDARKLPGRLPDKFWKDKEKFYVGQIRRIYALKTIAMDSRNFLLKRLREEHGLSQNDLAEKVEVSRQWIVHLEGGEVTRTISKKVKLRICEFLEVSYEQLFPVEHLLEMLIKKETI